MVDIDCSKKIIDIEIVTQDKERNIIGIAWVAVE
jgi:hypothetical protein